MYVLALAAAAVIMSTFMTGRLPTPHNSAISVEVVLLQYHPLAEISPYTLLLTVTVNMADSNFITTSRIQSYVSK